MTPTEIVILRQKIHQAIDTLPHDHLPEVFSLIQTLNPHVSNQPNKTAIDLFTFLQIPGNTWTDNDIPDCIENVLHSRSPITINHRINPFFKP